MITRFLALFIAALIGSDSVFAQAPLTKDIVLVLDNSGSMRETDPNALTKGAVAAFVGALEPDTALGMVVFDTEAREALPLTRLSDTTPDALNQTLTMLDYRGRRTNLAAALERAIYDLKQHGRPESSRSVVFLTDGVIDMGDRAKDRDSARWLRDELAADAADQEIALFSIALGAKADVLLLHALAQKTSGDYFRAEQAEDIAAVLGEIQARLTKRATPPPAPVPEEPAPTPPEPTVSGPPAPELSTPAGRPPETPELTEPPIPEPLPPSPPAAVPAPAMENLPKSLAPWLIGFSVVLAFLAFVAARILTWVKKAAQVPKGAALASTAQEALPKAFLHDLGGATSWKQHRFEKHMTWVGRIVMEPKADDADYLVVDKATVGRRHAYIEFKQHDFWLTDHDSVNGTYVNGRRIHAKARLKHGDHVRLGNCEFKFEMPAMALVDETSVVPGYVRGVVAGRRDTPGALAADPMSFEPVAPAAEGGADRLLPRAIAARGGDITDPPSAEPSRKGVTTTASRPALKDLDDPTLPSRKALKDDLKSYFED
jgi:uncharacterized protein YegL